MTPKLKWWSIRVSVILCIQQRAQLCCWCLLDSGSQSSRLVTIHGQYNPTTTKTSQQHIYIVIWKKEKKMIDTTMYIRSVLMFDQHTDKRQFNRSRSPHSVGWFPFLSFRHQLGFTFVFSFPFVSPTRLLLHKTALLASYIEAGNGI